MKILMSSWKNIRTTLRNQINTQSGGRGWLPVKLANVWVEMGPVWRFFRPNMGVQFNKLRLIQCHTSDNDEVGPLFSL